MTNDLAANKDGKIVTDSRAIADAFGKRHANVLQAIENLECSQEFKLRNFQPGDYADAKGQKRPLLHLLTQDGFAFFIMGFTGKNAAQWKEKFIAAHVMGGEAVNAFAKLLGQ